MQTPYCPICIHSHNGLYDGKLGFSIRNIDTFQVSTIKES